MVILLGCAKPSTVRWLSLTALAVAGKDCGAACPRCPRRPAIVVAARVPGGGWHGDRHPTGPGMGPSVAVVAGLVPATVEYHRSSFTTLFRCRQLKINTKASTMPVKFWPRSTSRFRTDKAWRKKGNFGTCQFWGLTPPGKFRGRHPLEQGGP